MPDPSCNPYLALAVMLRAGLDGIDQQTRPRPAGEQEHLQDEPPRAAAPAHRRAAGNLSEALDELEKRRPDAATRSASTSSTTSSQPSARSGTTTSAMCRRGRSSATSKCTY